MWKWFLGGVLCVLVVAALAVRFAVRADHDRAMQDLDAQRKAFRQQYGAPSSSP